MLPINQTLLSKEENLLYALYNNRLNRKRQIELDKQSERNLLHQANLQASNNNLKKSNFEQSASKIYGPKSVLSPPISKPSTSQIPPSMIPPGVLSTDNSTLAKNETVHSSQPTLPSSTQIKNNHIDVINRNDKDDNFYHKRIKIDNIENDDDDINEDYYSNKANQYSNIEDKNNESFNNESQIPIQSMIKIKKKNITALVDSDDEIEDSKKTNDHNPIHKEVVDKIMKLFDLIESTQADEWISIKANDPFNYLLKNFNIESGNQTVVLKLTVPTGSNSWSINITPENNTYETDILLHFNPRYKSSCYIMNDRQGTWGSQTKLSFKHKTSKLEPILSSSLELMIQINETAFTIFANGIVCCVFFHRRDPSKYNNLRLTMPAKDGNGNPQDVILHKIYWGRAKTPEAAKVALQNIPHKPTINSTALSNEQSQALRTIRIEGLPIIENLVELHAMEEALWELFEQFPTEKVSSIPGKGIGFVTLFDVDMVPAAIEALNHSLIAGGDNFTEQCELKMSRNINHNLN
eukprot:gene14440-19377_t